jgi:tRNA nucleotidyltransferase (CCA-adding enzyme)
MSHCGEFTTFPALTVPADVHTVMQTLADHGHKVWIVGGAIRDTFLGLEPKDWDLATTAPPEQVVRLFPRVVPIGIRHGTVQVRVAQRAIEITSLDGVNEEALPRDLARRDFTVNAMALSFPGGRLVDPHGGRTDIESRSLRGVRDAAARFREDPLRTLRAGRLVSAYGFNVEEKTRRALAEASHGLTSVAPERIREEAYKLLVGPYVVEGLRVLRKGSVLGLILPELNAERVFLHALETVHHCPPRLRLRLAALLHGIGAPQRSQGPPPAAGLCTVAARQSSRLAQDILLRWRSSHLQIRELGLIVELQPPLQGSSGWSDGDLRRWLAASGTELLDDLIDLAHAKALSCPMIEPSGAAGAPSPVREVALLTKRIGRLLQQNPPLTIQRLALNGEDVMRLLRLSPGPLVGTLLRRLHDHVLEDPERNTYAALSEILEREYDPRQHEAPE